MDKKIIEVIYMPTDKIFELEIDSSMKIYEVKKKIGEILNIEIDHNCNIYKRYLRSRIMIALSNENHSVRDYHIHNNVQIVIGEKNVGGGRSPDEFANLSEEFLRKDDVLPSGSGVPGWRHVHKGINLYGVCQHDSCVAKGKQVIMMVYSKEYDVVKESFMGICPMCQKHFDLDTCSFYKCDYKCEGRYFDKKKDKWVDLPNKVSSTSNCKDDYFDYNKVVDGKEGKVKYQKLILKVVRYHDDNDK